MIDPAGRAHHIASLETMAPGSSGSKVPRFQSFEAELTSSLKGAAPTSNLPASLPPGQEIATWREPNATGLNGLVITFPSTTSGTGSVSKTTATSQQPESFDNAYWAKQPAAVQQLREIPNQTARAAAAEQLTQEGYSVDVPIMVWGWDPATTTAARESMGYTWVPSAQQQAVEAAPGVTYAGTVYNPTQPPSGSIIV
jgi:hypothetical protein